MLTQIIKIYSENNAFQYIETLRRNREKRHRNKEFFVEGVRSINLALKFGWQINAFIYSTERKLSNWAQEILKNSQAKIHYELPLNLLQKISDKEDTSELLALVQIPEDLLEKILPKKSQGNKENSKKNLDNFLIVIFDRPSSPGNLGTIIRSCDALNAYGLIITGHSVDLYDPETIRASTGSLFSLPITRLPSQNELIPWLEKLKTDFPNFQIVGTDEKATISIYEHDFKKPTILLVGNETNGLSHAYQELCNTMVKIPISETGAASSLNVACATTTILYEINRQRNY